MLITLTPETGVPLYRQLADAVRQAIASGELGEGEALPSVRALGAELRVNYHTVARAYRDLEGEGVLQRRRGGPFTVAAGSAEAEAEGLLGQDLDRLLDRAAALGISLDELVQRLRARARAR